MSYLKARTSHCPNCDEWLGIGNCDLTLGELCQLVALCPECNHEIAIVTTEEVLA